MLTHEQRQIVKRARDRIADPANWCHGANARTADGSVCKVTDPRAHSFCGFGALEVEYRAAGSEFPHICSADELADQLAFGGRALSTVNDEDGHAAVLALFDSVLAEA